MESSSQQIRAQAREHSALRCALCHGGDGEQELGTLETCPGCQTTLHAGCREGNNGCPTLGCSRQARNRPVRRRTPRRRRQPVDWRTALRVACGIGAGVLVFVGLLGMLISLVFLGDYRMNDIVAGAAGFIGSALLVASGMLSLTLLLLFGNRDRGEPE